ncbi:hypothetical protein [Psychromonas sp.]|uniref:hypothetical protein n=1 Tax=Psychromonas sp. TaxID=1884585 RepID=UPI003566266B
MFQYSLKKTFFIFLATFALLLTTGFAHAHSGPLNAIAVKACDAKAISEACQFEGGHGDLYIGTCQYMSTALMCVRNQPIQTIEFKKAGSEGDHEY